MLRLGGLTFLLATLVLIGPVASAQSPDTLYYGVDMQRDTLTLKSGPAEDIQKIVILCAVPSGDACAKLLTLRASTGEQLGQAVAAAFPPSPCHPPDPGHPPEPGLVLHSRYFQPDNVVTVTDNFGLMTLPVTLARDGTPQLGSWSCGIQAADPTVAGYATAMAEFRGDFFGDGFPRLLIGTDLGKVVVLMARSGSPIYESTLEFGAASPVNGIAPILTYGPTVQAGIGTGVDIYGLLDIDAGAAASVAWTLTNPTANAITGLVALDNQFPPNPINPADIAILEEGSSEIGLAAIPSGLSGNASLNVHDYSVPPNPVIYGMSQICAGSLLLLSSDSAGVWYDPNFDDSLGFGNCILIVSENIADQCGLCCDLAGDFDNNFSVDVSDLTAMVDYMFNGGIPAPCGAEADVDDNCSIDISDLTYRVDWMFSGGPAPLCGCL